MQKLHLQPISQQLKETCDFYDILQQAISEVPELIDDAKNNYYMLANKVKTYIDPFYNNKKYLDTTNIHSILKANHFNKYFASKCTPINNDSSSGFSI